MHEQKYAKTFYFIIGDFKFIRVFLNFSTNQVLKFILPFSCVVIPGEIEMFSEYSHSPVMSRSCVNSTVTFQQVRILETT